jgi:cytoskeletal protein CcmA (bactofilin family)
MTSAPRPPHNERAAGEDENILRIFFESRTLFVPHWIRLDPCGCRFGIGETVMFSKSKSGLEKKKHEASVNITRPAEVEAAASVSTLAAGVFMTGNVVCEGAMQVFGRIIGEIHSIKLTIGNGARVEGQVIAEEVVIAGQFKGTIHAKSVRLERTAVVEGEIYKHALVIDQDAQFEGTARKLEKSLELPSTGTFAAAPFDAPSPVIAYPAASAEPAREPIRSWG